MKRCNTKHMRFKGYADGGKVVKEVLGTEYNAGVPTFGKAVKASLGFGDGYGKPTGSGGMSATKTYKPVTKQGKDVQTAVSNRKKALDDL